MLPYPKFVKQVFGLSLRKTRFMWSSGCRAAGAPLSRGSPASSLCPQIIATTAPALSDS